jgi:chlorite dismutase
MSAEGTGATEATLSAPPSPDEIGVFGTFALFELGASWAGLNGAARRVGAREPLEAITAHAEHVAVDGYLTLGLTERSHFLLRLHARQPEQSQAVIAHLLRTRPGRHLIVRHTLTGVTQPLVYASQAPDQLQALQATEYAGELPPRYAVVIPTRKSAAWWNLPEAKRLALMREHTAVGIEYLAKVKRQLYRATGLADADFITWFETDDLTAFSELVARLRMLREDTYNERLGAPTILGTARTLEELFTELAR